MGVGKESDLIGARTPAFDQVGQVQWDMKLAGGFGPDERVPSQCDGLLFVTDLQKKAGLSAFRGQSDNDGCIL